jgi:hypothetical protein
MNSPNTGNRNKLLASGECFCPKAARNESKWSAMFSWFDFDTGCGRPADFGLCDSPNIGLHEAQAHHVYHSHWCLFTTQADWIQVERENHYISLYFTSETYPWYPLVSLGSCPEILKSPMLTFIPARPLSVTRCSSLGCGLGLSTDIHRLDQIEICALPHSLCLAAYLCSWSIYKSIEFMNIL